MEPETSNFHSRPSLRWDQPGSVTPPPQKPGSIPFLWEEKPGKPKKSVSDSRGPLSARSLKLPPRLVAEMKGVHHVDSDSPTTVLDGPDLVNPNRMLVPCHSFNSSREEKNKGRREIRKAWFNRRKKKDEKEVEKEKKDQVQEITRLRRNKSLTSVSSLHGNGSSHFWAGIRENLKQVLPWRKYRKTRSD